MRRLYYKFIAWRTLRSLEKKGLLDRTEEGWEKTDLGEAISAMIVTKEDIRG